MILITGASGVLGRALVDAFTKAGVAVRQAVRDLRKAKPGIESVRFDYTDPACLEPAMAGVEGLLLMAPPLDPDAPAKLRPTVLHAKEAGLRQVIFVSALGANHAEQSPLRVAEHLVMDSGIPYTILRPNFFMENFSEGFLAGSIRHKDGIFLPAGDGKTSFISVRDIASVALCAFQKQLFGRQVDLTGPEALDHAQVAEILSEVCGRRISYHALTEEQMAETARAAGIPEAAVAYLMALYSAVRAGYAEIVTADFEQITGRKPTAFREFARASAEAWK